LDRTGYAEAELVENRVAVLLFGATLADRLAWAEEAAVRIGGPATVVATVDALPAALAQKEGVVFIVDAVALGDAAQQTLVRCLLTQEERPKLVVGVQRIAEAALGAGGLRPDLHYRLRLAQVNLDQPGLREAIARRRARGIAPRFPVRPSTPPPASPPAAARPAPARAKPAKRRAPPAAKRRTPAKKPAKKLRSASSRRSRR
jgi:hypothetical protein